MIGNDAKSAASDRREESTSSTDGDNTIVQQTDLLPGDVLLYRSAGI